MTPAYCTAGLVVLVLVNALNNVVVHHTGAYAANPTVTRADMVSTIFTTLVKWLLVAWIYGVTRQQGGSLRTLIGGKWNSWRSILRDVMLALVFLVVLNIGSDRLLELIFPPKTFHLIQAQHISPHGRLDTVVWLASGFSAGVCEEIMFRGFLQRRFTSITKSRAAGLGIQSVLFGLVHGYQSVMWTVLITFIGMSFGLLAQWRQSLRPGIIAHVLQDVL